MAARGRGDRGLRLGFAFGSCGEPVPGAQVLIRLRADLLAVDASAGHVVLPSLFHAAGLSGIRVRECRGNRNFPAGNPKFLNPGEDRGYTPVSMSRREPETDLGGARPSFQSTLWSVVLRAKDPAAGDRREALQKLIETYWKPLYGFVRRKGHGVEAGKDIIQGFFTELLAKDYLQYVDRGRGKFRSFILTALEHYMADEYDRAKAQKRGGGRLVLSLDFQDAEVGVAGHGGGEGPDAAFKRDWALNVMMQAMARVKAHYESGGRVAEFDAFRAHLSSVRPEGASYEALAATLGLGVEDVRNRVRSARARFREAILEVIRAYTDSEAEAAEELNDLLTAFS